MIASMAEPTIYHNPRCSKSRVALDLLRERGAKPTVIDYLSQPPDARELAALCRRLGLRPRELVRTGEAVFAERYAEAELDDAGWIAAMVADPILIQRPIVVVDDRAVIGRPPERVLELMEE